MSTYSEIKDIPEKFKVHIDKLKELFKKNNIRNVNELRKLYKTDKKFQTEWKEIWTDIAKAEGGKLSLTTVGIIIGSVLGGVGIAAMGGAIGMPLAFILGLSGFLVGTKFDDTKLLSAEKNISVSLPNDLIERLKNDASQIGCSVEELIELLIKQVYNTD